MRVTTISMPLSKERRDRELRPVGAALWLRYTDENGTRVVFVYVQLDKAVGDGNRG